MSEAPARINLELCSGMGRDFYREVGSHPMDEPIAYVRADIVDELRAAANELADVAYLALTLIDQDEMASKAGWDALDISAADAITKARAALAKSEGGE